MSAPQYYSSSVTVTVSTGVPATRAATMMRSSSATDAMIYHELS
jgi:hypothetical protein